MLGIPKEVKLKVFNPCSALGSKKRGNVPNFAQTCTHLLRTVPGSSRGRGREAVPLRPPATTSWRLTIL